MSKLTPKDLAHVAELARLEIPEKIREKLEFQFNEIVAYVEKLAKLDTRGIEPTSQVISPGEGTPTAQDHAHRSFPKEEVVMNAPDCQDQFFKVPRMLGED